MSDEHKRTAAALLERAEEATERGFPTVEQLTMEALVHAVLHLAEVVDVRVTVGRER